MPTGGSHACWLGACSNQGVLLMVAAAGTDVHAAAAYSLSAGSSPHKSCLPQSCLEALQNLAVFLPQSTGWAGIRAHGTATSSGKARSKRAGWYRKH